MTTEPKARYDVRADVPYHFCEEGEIGRSVEVLPGVTVEFGNAGNILGVEILVAPQLTVVPAPSLDEAFERL
jgi:uncharacterized protein YuzE